MYVVVNRRRSVGAALSVAMVGAAVLGGSALSHSEFSRASWVPTAVTIPLIDIDRTLGQLTVVRMLEAVLDNVDNDVSAQLNGHNHTQWAPWWQASGELSSWLRAGLDTAAGIAGGIDANGWSSAGSTAVQLGQLGQLATEVQGLRLAQLFVRAGLSPQQVSERLDGLIVNLDRLGFDATLAQAVRAAANVSAVLGDLTADGLVSRDEITSALDLLTASAGLESQGSIADFAQGSAGVQGKLGELTSNFSATSQGVEAELRGIAASLSTGIQGSLQNGALGTLAQGSAALQGTLAQLALAELKAYPDSLSAKLQGTGAVFAAGTQGSVGQAGQASAGLQGSVGQLTSAELQAYPDSLSAELQGTAAAFAAGTQGSVAGLGQAAAALQGQLAQFSNDLQTSAQGIDAVLSGIAATGNVGVNGAITGVGQGSANVQGQLAEAVTTLAVTPTRAQGGVAFNLGQLAAAASVRSADGNRGLDVDGSSRAQTYGQVCAGTSCAGGLLVEAGFDLSSSARAMLMVPNAAPLEVKVNAPNHLDGRWTRNEVRLTGELGGTVQVGSVTVGRIIPVDINIPTSSTLRRTAGSSSPAPASATAPDSAAPAVPRPTAHRSQRHHPDTGTSSRSRTDGESR